MRHVRSVHHELDQGYIYIYISNPFLLPLLFFLSILALYLHAGDPANDSITGKDDIKLIGFRELEEIQDVRADKGGLDARILSQLGRKGDGGITDIDAQGIFGAETVDERKGVLTGIALDMTDLETSKVTEEFLFLPEES